MVASLNGDLSATIISCYSPTNVREETELIAFYDELVSLVRSIPKHNVLVNGGDKNAQIFKNVNHKFSLHNASSRNGEHLTDFTLENRWTCLNTKIQIREEKLWPSLYTNNSKAHIDYVLMNTKWNKIPHWIARLTPHSRLWAQITELSRQKYDSA